MFRSVMVIFILSGCSTLGSKEAVIGCQGADIASTHYALHHGATEQNPLPVPLLDLLKVAFSAYIYHIPDAEWESYPVGVRVFVTAVGCGAAVNNIHVAHEKP